MDQCGFCFSSNVIQHNEGTTCLECHRLCDIICYGVDRDYNVIHFSNHLKPIDPILSELAFRNGLPNNLVLQINDFLDKARFFFKTISKIDLTLISIYQGYLQNRSFISFNKLKYFHPTKTSISLLNNLHFKLVENKVFKFHPEFSYEEILFSLIQFFKISHSNHLTIKKYIHIFQSTLQHSTNIHIVASVCYFLISNQTINLNLNINEILLFFGVRKSTIMNKIRVIKKSAIL